MHVVLDDDLHADAHVVVIEKMNSSMMMATTGEPEDLHHGRWLRPSSDITIRTTSDGERNIGDRGDALVPEMIGAGFGRAEAAHAGERRADVLGAASLIAALP